MLPSTHCQPCRSADAQRLVADIAAPRLLIFMGIGLATGAPDTQTAPITTGRPPEITLPPVGFPTGGFVFLGPVKPD
jgi:hypothetical protein